MDADARPTTPRRGPGTRWRPRAEVVAGILGTLGVSIVVVSLLVWASRGFEQLPASYFGTPLGQLPQLATAACYILVGAFLGARLPRNPVGWLFLGIGLLWTVFLPANLYIAGAYEAFRPASTLTSLVAWVLSSFGTAALLGLLAAVGLLFPDGRLLSRRWRGAAWLTAISVLVFGLSVGLDPAGLEVYPSLPNPFAAPSALEPVYPALRLARLLIVVPLVAVAISLVLRYRGGDLVVRAQLRWIVLAATLQALAFIPFILATFVFRVSDPVGSALAAMAQVAGIAVPLAAGVAIMRYRLFGIDAIISRTLVYVLLMGVLGGLYALAVTVFQRLFVALTGGTSEVPLLIALFLTAAAFTPLRKALEGAVDGWVHRDRPSARSEAEAEAVKPDEAASDESELRRVAAALVALRRLETRMTSATPAAQGGAERSLPVDAAGQVSCPRGRQVPFAACLGCPQLVGISTSPPQVTCTAPDLP
jgi:uncharacterized membrane protein